MNDANSPQKGAPSREERLAARLRENLHRRKAQARAMAAPGGSIEGGAGESLPKSDLSKTGDGR